MFKRLVMLVVLAFALPSLAAAKGDFKAAQKSALKALKSATKKIDSVPACANTQAGNIKDASKKVQSFTRTTPQQSFDDMRVYLAGVALAGAFSSCPNELSTHITAAQNAISAMGLATKPAPAAPVYADDDEEEEDEYEAPAARAPAAPVAAANKGVTADDVVINPNFVDNTGQQAIYFAAIGTEASNLQGKKISWNLIVKRKNQAWTKAKAFNITESRVTQPLQSLGDIAISVRYTTFAREGLKPGEHVAAIVGSLGAKSIVYRDEIPFVLPATAAPVMASDDDEEDEAPPAPKAMNKAAFSGLLAAVNGASTDFTKVEMVKSASKKSYFTSAQLGALLDTMSTDFSKLDASKAAVPKLVDSENAYGLAEKFSTGFSKQEFTKLL